MKFVTILQMAIAMGPELNGLGGDGEEVLVLRQLPLGKTDSVFLLHAKR
jgi:hypothetical protein